MSKCENVVFYDRFELVNCVISGEPMRKYLTRTNSECPKCNKIVWFSINFLIKYWPFSKPNKFSFCSFDSCEWFPSDLSYILFHFVSFSNYFQIAKLFCKNKTTTKRKRFCGNKLHTNIASVFAPFCVFSIFSGISFFILAFST